MSWLDPYFQTVIRILDNGTILPERPKLNVIGGSLVDNPGANRIDLTIAGGFPVSLSDGSVAATASKWLIRGSSAEAKAAWLESGTGTPAGIALVRSANNVAAWASRGAGAYDVQGALVNASDVIVSGDDSHAAGFDSRGITGSLWKWTVNASEVFRLSATQVLAPSGTISGTPAASVPSISFLAATTAGFAYSSGFAALVALVGGDAIQNWRAVGTSIAPPAQSSGSPVALTVTVPVHTTLANAEANAIALTHASGGVKFTGGTTITTQRAVLFGIPDYRMNSAGTITGAATLAIGGAPTSGDASVTFTNGPWAIWVQGGKSKFEGAIGAFAGTVSAPGVSTYADLDTGVYWPATNSVALACGGVQVLAFTSTACVWTQSAAVAAAAVGLSLTAGAHTNLPASTENIDVRFDLGRTVQWATGALTTQRHMLITAPTLAFVGASTVTTAATVAISGAPIAGTNATLTNSYAFWSQSGIVRLDGTLQLNGSFAHLGSTFGAFSVAAASRQVSGANLTNGVTSGGTDDAITNWTDLTVYAMDAAAIRNAVYQLARKMKQINDGLRLYGLFT